MPILCPPDIYRILKSSLGLAAVVVGVSACSTPPMNQAGRSLAHNNKSLPLVIAHRAGADDCPENTLTAIDGALRNGADAIWLTVQLSSDGVPVLYRPADLAANTEGAGPVTKKTFNELQQLNAGWHFARIDPDGSKNYPYRAQPLPIPSLEQALKAVPASVPLVLDMKALPAGPQAEAVAQVLDTAQAWRRVLIYSTDASYQAAFAKFPQATLFESRDQTRGRLAGFALAQECVAPPKTGSWVAFEYRRKVQLVESFTLGEGRSPVNARLWTPAAVDCFNTTGKVNILAIGINSAEDYQAAACLGIDAVLADSPQKMQAIKKRLSSAMDCSAKQ
ncbi:glycerophosphodiester phosphodiesterase family protein [Chitinimonas sp. PSY-7]|uniref:glycerophosphodiester phosphodiesterase family protein n=1 Tax=Chitinimonas sp. PSY-7 TaxID=3459088 RepID=UPI00403FE540